MTVRAALSIETDRLLLRKPERRDAADIFARYAGDPDATRYLSWPRHASLEDTHAFLAFSDDEWNRWPAGPYLVCSRTDGGLLGSSGLSFETPYRAVTGYVFAPDAWGKGYATETLRAMVTLASTVGLQRLYALCHTEHRASWRVLEKCGFVREGILQRHSEFPNLSPGTAHDVFCYATVQFSRGRSAGALTG